MGWVKTIDEYFAGSKMEKDHSSVRNTLDTVIHEMNKD
jgi:hypothetical protein